MDSLAPPEQKQELPFYLAWIQAVSKPNPPAYEDLISRPGVSSGKGILWVFAASLVGWLVAVPLIAAVGFPAYADLARQLELPDLGSLGVALLCFVPLGAAFAALGLVLFTGLNHVIARALGGAGEFSQLMYAVAAYTAPIAIVSPALGVLPVISCLSSLLGIYTIYLNIVAIKAVHRLSWGRAFLASTLMISLVIVALACFFVAMLAVFGAFAASGSS